MIDSGGLLVALGVFMAAVFMALCIWGPKED
jgi:hypothetical protein